MAIEIFWGNVRQAAGLVVPRGLMTEVADVPPQAYLEEKLQATVPIWRRGVSVVGYDDRDFHFLSPVDREKLADAVKRFNEAVAKDAPTDPNQRDPAAEAFATILGVLNFHQYADVQAFPFGKRIEEKLRQQGWPGVVRELRFSISDPFGDPPVFNVTAVLKEAELKTERKFLEQARIVHQRLEQIADEVAPEWFAHVMCRTDKPLTEYEQQPDEDELMPAGRG